MRSEFQALVNKEEVGLGYIKFLSDEDFHEFLEALKKNNSLKSLNLPDAFAEQHEERFGEFLQLLRQNNSLERLWLGRSGLDDARLEKICTVLKEKENLIHFGIAGNSIITSQGIQAVKSLLKKNKSIGLEDIEGNYRILKSRGPEAHDLDQIMLEISSIIDVSKKIYQPYIKRTSRETNDDTLKVLLESLHNHYVKYIDLSASKITSKGLRFLVKFLESNPSVVDVNLKSNLIYSRHGNDFDSLIELVRDRVESKRKGEGEALIVRLGYNYIHEEARVYIEDRLREEGDEETQRDKIKSFDIIQTPPDINYRMPNVNVNGSYSNLIDSPYNTISKKKWMVFLARKGDGNHAMIFIQGVREFDQCFIDKFHFVSNAAGNSCTIFTSVGETKIHKDLDPVSLLWSFRRYKFKCQEITREEGLALKENILAQKNNPPTFEITGTVGNNCLTWAKSMLKTAGIHFKFKDSAYLINDPSRAITGREDENKPPQCTIS